MKKSLLVLFFIILLSSAFVFYETISPDENFVTYIVNLEEKEVKFYWKDENNINLKSIGNLKNWLQNKNQELLFATNGGMYKNDYSPLGLFIENFEIKSQLDTLNGNGNFYLKPNGVFFITKENKAKIISTEKYCSKQNIKFATQSGPMLIINNKIHSAFKENSKNLNIRNGVGILENGNIVFIMSKKEVNFYNFASYFKKLGCKNALYLDGFVSRTYLPEQNWIQTDGNFGVIIGITKK